MVREGICWFNSTGEGKMKFPLSITILRGHRESNLGMDQAVVSLRELPGGPARGDAAN